MGLTASFTTFKKHEILHKNLIKKVKILPPGALLPPRQQEAGVKQQLFLLPHLNPDLAHNHGRLRPLP